MLFKKRKIGQSESSGILKKTLVIIAAYGVFFLGVSLMHAVKNTQFQVYNFSQEQGVEKKSFLSNISDRILPKSSEAKVKENIYILLTGRGGEGHDGGKLTDTIMLASINFQKEYITMFSIPRDLYVAYPNNDGTGKINSVYQHYIDKGHNYAIDQLKKVVQKITGKTVHYSVDVDFQGFVEIVNTLGGVQVRLEQDLIDYQYPNGNFGYQKFHLPAGTWNLSGEVALMYVRSRYSTSDFDRSMRQQEVLSSLRSKVRELGYFRDRKKIFELIDVLQNYVVTDISALELLDIVMSVRAWDNSRLLSAHLNDSCMIAYQCLPGGFLYTPVRELFGNQSVFLPNGADITSISYYPETQTYSDFIFTYPDIYMRNIPMEIYNASGKSGKAAEMANTLMTYGIFIDKNTGLKNITQKDFEKSIIYYNGIDDDDPLLEILKKISGISLLERREKPFEGIQEQKIEIILAH